MPARLRNLPIGMPNARSTSSEGTTREPCTKDEALRNAADEAMLPSHPLFGSPDVKDLLREARSAVSIEAILAGCSLRSDPRSEMPLAVSTARRKLTHAIESRTPVSIKSAVSLGSGTEGPVSPRKQVSAMRLKGSSPLGE